MHNIVVQTSSEGIDLLQKVFKNPSDVDFGVRYGNRIRNILDRILAGEIFVNPMSLRTEIFQLKHEILEKTHDWDTSLPPQRCQSKEEFYDDTSDYQYDEPN